MPKTLQIFSLKEFQGLSQSDQQVKVNKTNQRWKTYSKEISQFFARTVDDFFRPKPEEEIATLWKMLQCGDFYFCLEDNEFVGMIYAAQEFGGRSVSLAICGDVSEQHFENIIKRLFENSPIKIIARLFADSPEIDFLLQHGFQVVGVLRLDSLLSGKLLDNIMLERYHPQWLAPVAEEVEIDGELLSTSAAGGAELHGLAGSESDSELGRDDAIESHDVDDAAANRADAESAAVCDVQQQPAGEFEIGTASGTSGSGQSESGLHVEDVEPDGRRSKNKRSKPRSK